jgi:hypothetical protein
MVLTNIPGNSSELFPDLFIQSKEKRSKSCEFLVLGSINCEPNRRRSLISSYYNVEYVVKCTVITSNDDFSVSNLYQICIYDVEDSDVRRDPTRNGRTFSWLSKKREINRNIMQVLISDAWHYLNTGRHKKKMIVIEAEGVGDIEGLRTETPRMLSKEIKKKQKENKHFWSSIEVVSEEPSNDSDIVKMKLSYTEIEDSQVKVIVSYQYQEGTDSSCKKIIVNYNKDQRPMFFKRLLDEMERKACTDKILQN